MSLMNSKELEFMTNSGLIQDVSLRFGVIGAGQKGNKDADIFAGYRFADGTQCYPTLAINFAQADMIHLKNIPEKDRIHFD
jgi:tubulin-like protein CetZ